MIVSTIWQIVYWAWVASEFLVLIITRTRRDSGNTRDRGSLLILWPTIFTSIFAAIWIGESRPPTIFGGEPWVRVVSLVLLVAGLVIRWSSIFTLGKSFSANVAIHSAQTIHKRGLFRFVRHPSYSALLIIFLAIGLHARNWLSVAIVLIPTLAALLYRIRVEEAALNEAFGNEYARYSEKTKRLIPGIY